MKKLQIDGTTKVGAFTFAFTIASGIVIFLASYVLSLLDQYWASGGSLTTDKFIFGLFFGLGLVILAIFSFLLYIMSAVIYKYSGYAIQKIKNKYFVDKKEHL